MDEKKTLSLGTWDPKRPKIRNPDGSFSTEETITVGGGPDRPYANIPTIVDGQRINPLAAEEMYYNNALMPFEEYGSLEDALKAAKLRSRFLGWNR